MSATTSFDDYLHHLCVASLSSAGYPPEGGRTAQTTKGLLASDLKDHVIDESDLKIQKTASISHILISKSSLTEEDIGSIPLYPKTKKPLIYSGGKWNLDLKRHKKPKQKNAYTDSNEPGTTSEDSDDTCDDEYNGTGDPGSKRKRRTVTIEKVLQHLFTAIEYSLCRSPWDKITFNIPPQSEPVKRYWSAEFSTSPIPDPYNSQKPDLTLFDYRNKNLSKKTWADVLSFVEHTASDLSKRQDIPVYWGSSTKAYLIMREQPWHRFIIYFTICADFLRIHYLDRSGLIMSYPVNIHSFPVFFTEAIGTASLADPKMLGFDDTMHMCIQDCKGSHADLADGAIGWVYNNRGKQYSIMDILWKSQGLFCRGTVCYRVRDPEDGIDYAMKDCWVAEAKRYHEVNVLGRVKGIPNVVELVEDWDVKYDGQDDCTRLIRQQYNIPPEDRGDKKFCNRYHRRLVMKPCGEPLSKFRSKRELICAFRDFVVAHDAMTRVQVLHGDLSPNNFILHEGTSYFIDFDHAAILEEGSTSISSFGTGTMPYISLRILDIMSKNADIAQKVQLENANSTPNVASRLITVIHASSDDLESLFYIFFEFVARYGGARGVTAKSWNGQTIPWSNAYENLTGNVLGSTFLVKKGAISTSDWWSIRVSPYFEKLKPIVEEWRSLISIAAQGGGDIAHDRIREMLEIFIATFDDESPYLLPSPSLPPEPPSSHTTTASSRTTTGSPTFQSTLQPTGGSSSLTRPARRSLRLREKSK